MYVLGIARDDFEIGSRWLIGFCPALLPITQRTNRNVITGREFFLSESQGATEGLHPWHSLGLAQLLRGHRTCVRISICGGSNLSLCHPAHRYFGKRLLVAVPQHLDDFAVSSNS